jgi:hypothetical protein
VIVMYKIGISVYLISGMYSDGHARHPTNSVELYLPWSDSWIPLPPLPNIVLDDGTALPMTDTLIMSLAATLDTNSLHVMGGANTNWNTGMGQVTSEVWQLHYNSANHTHYWDYSIHDLGKYVVWRGHVVIIIFTDIAMSSLQTAALGVPDNFFQYFNF